MKNKKRDRSGVAVIIVLGMLALLMIMGVAFSVSMRVERRSAGNYSHSVSTKNLVWAGLASAIDRIEDEVGDDMFPDFDIVESDYSASDMSYVMLGRGEALDYIPGAFTNSAKKIKSGWSTFNVTWRNGGIRSTNIPGRYAYLILNCSDFIDANYAGGTNRLGGIGSQELQLDTIMGGSNPQDLFENRDYDIRYETLQEMNAIIGNEIGRTFTNNDLVVYSRYPGGSGRFFIGGNQAELMAKKGDIKKHLETAVSGAADYEFMFNSLIDYIDEDSVPFALDEAYTERIPMINEVIVHRFQLKRNQSTAVLRRPEISFELAYPFVEESDESFNIQMDVTVEIHDNPITTNVVLNYSVLTNTTAGEIAESYNRNVFSFSDETFDMTNTLSLSVDFEIKGKVIISGGADDGEIVDEVPSPYAGKGLEIKFNAGKNTFRVDRTHNTQPSLECIDPRSNWDTVKNGEKLDKQQWLMCTDADLNTERELNSAAKRWFASPRYNRNLGFETNLQLRVSNKGHLESVGELSNLLRRSHLRMRYNTLRLYDYSANKRAKRDRVFEEFTVVTNNVIRGSVNINSPFSEMISPAFVDVPLKYPESFSDSHNNQDKLGDSAVLDDILDKLISNRPAGGYTNLAGICTFDWRKAIPSLSSRSDFEVESIITHTYGLLGIRQNLFAIIIAASPVTTGMGEFARTTKEVSALGSKRAIAYVWRDPVPDKNGRHKCFVQFFKWL